MKKICIVTGYDSNYHELVKVSLPNYIEYCNIHSVDLHISKKNSDVHVHYGWNKFHILKEILPNYDWVIWMDADCVFVNKQKDIRSLIDENYSLIIGNNTNPPDWYTEDTSYIENGVFLLKNDHIGSLILDRCLSGEKINHPWVDQYKMIIELKDEILNKHVKKIELKEINGIHNLNFKKEEIFIYHCAGGNTISISDKIELMKNKLN